MATRVFVETFKGNKCFAVWEVDERGDKVGKYPVISFGAKKAHAIVNHAEELQDFVKQNEPPKVERN